MPVVHVNVWKGFPEYKVKVLIEKMTQIFVEMDVPAQAVDIIVHEVPKTHWGTGGELCSEKFKDIEP
jgi:4-oxalocrotonate tautomerase